MNIVMIGPFGLRPKGTMAVRALPLAHALAERGHRVTILLPPWSYRQDSGRSYSVGNVSVVNIALPPAIPLLQHMIITWRLVRAALALRPDVIHCFKPKAYSGLVALVLLLGKRLRLWRARLVMDSDDWEGYGGWNDIERYSRIQKAFFAWQERWGLTHADAITVASRALETIVWSLGVPRATVFYVPNGTPSVPEADRVRRQEASQPTSAPPSGPTVLLYTRFFEFAVERVVDIIAGVLRDAPAARCVVVGKGLFGEEQRFLQQIAAIGLAQRVTYAGWRQPEELPSYFAAADVAVYPYDDTLINRTKCSVKLIDLLSAGVPVVADRVGQNAEYIEHGASGILVEPDDTQSFVAWVVRLLEDSALRSRLGKNARERMVTHFTWLRLAAVVEEAYRC